MTAANRVALNTCILYAKMLITMCISLYSARVVLNALGKSDYGTYNLVAGVIFVLAFLNAAMATSTQRFLSFHQGAGNFDIQKKVFTNSWVLHTIIGAIVAVALFAMIPFLFGGFLNIPVDRIGVAKTIYCFMSVAVFFTIISVPFAATLNARENMLWIAVVNIIEAVCKLCIALSIVHFAQAQRLGYYGLLMMIVSVIVFLLLAWFCLKKYPECSVRTYKTDKSLLKAIGSFAGWNLFGAFSGIARNQGLAVLLNLFFGTVINAAFGIAHQVSSQLSYLSATLVRAMNPQIMKSEGGGDRRRMLRLAMMESKFGFFLMALVATPVIFEMSSILTFWLKNVPEFTSVFCSLVLIDAMILQLTIGLQAANEAIGKIRAFKVVVGSIQIANLPVAFVLLKLGYAPYSVLFSSIALRLIAGTFRMIFLKYTAGMSILEYIRRVFVKIIIPLSALIITCWIITNYLDFEYRFALTCASAAIVFVVATYFAGLESEEKELVKGVIKRFSKR